MKIKSVIDQITKLIQKQSTITHSKQIYNGMRKAKAEQAMRLASEVFYIISHLKTYEKTLILRNIFFLDYFVSPSDPENVPPSYFNKISSLEVIESLKQMLCKEYVVSPLNISEGIHLRILIDLWALCLFYSLPGKISAIVEIKVDGIFSQVVELAAAICDTSILRSIPEFKRISRIREGKANNQKIWQTVAKDIYEAKLKAKKDWLKDTNRTRRAKYICEQLPRAQGKSEKSIFNFLKVIENQK